MICEGCKQEIDERTIPARVALLTHSRATPVGKLITVPIADVALFCTVGCMRDWCDRIMKELGYS